MTHPVRRTALAVVAVMVYAAMWCGWVLDWGWVVDTDAVTLDVSHRIGAEQHAWVTFWNALCTVFSPAVFRLVTLVMIGYELVRRRARVALFLALSVELSAALIVLAKYLADRPRPATALVSASSTSFPSGHAVGAMVAVLALTLVYGPRSAGAMRSAVLIAGALVVVLVGVGRVALNVHHLSDVVAGWALGYLYLAVCLPVLREPRVRAAAERPEAPDTGR